MNDFAANRPEPWENPLRKAMGSLRRTLVTVGLFSAAVNILMLTGPMFMLQVYDRVLSSGSVPTLIGLFVIVVVLYSFLGIYDFLRARLLSRGGFWLDKAVGTEAFRRWILNGVGAKGRPGRPLADLNAVRNFLASPAPLGLFDLPWIPFYLAVVFFIHSWLGYLAISGAFVVTALALINHRITQKPLAQAMAMDASESQFVEQGYRNADTIVPLGMLGNITTHWQNMHGAGLARGQIGGERGERFTAASKSFRMLLQSSLLGLGGYLALQQEISAGMIVAASIIAGRALAPVDQVIGQWKGIIRARESYRRLREMLDAPQSTIPHIDLPEPDGRISVVAATKFLPSAERRSERPPILNRVSFNLEPGDGLGVIGPSASGKSTLAKMLVGAWQADMGEVRLDGAEIQQWDPTKLGRFIGYLPQNLELLAGTIRDNIARFDTEATDEAVVAAATIAGVHEMILKLPEGYSTRIGFGATPLSGGQTQRVGLARAVFGMPKLVVLDEPNSNLDPTGDEALSNAIQHLRSQGSTVVVMAHRPSAIAAVNKVLMLQDGNMIDFGEKAEVLQRVTRAASGEKSAPNPTGGRIEPA